MGPRTETAEIRPVRMSELLEMRRWELAQLIKLLAADRDPREIRELVEQVKHDYQQKQVAGSLSDKRR